MLSLIVTVLLVGPAGAQQAGQNPQLDVEQRGNVTNVTIGGPGWGGVIKDIQAVRALPADKDAAVIDKLQKDIDVNPPAYIYELVRRLCPSDPHRAMYLFAVAGSRMRYDAYRCVDESALEGITTTLMSLPMPDCKALADEKLIMAQLRKSRGSKELFTSKASPWWMCSHGMEAMGAALNKKTLQTSDWLKPESEWPAIRQTILGDLDATVKTHASE
jgi:hypothetical protein